ncbi:uncharacterized protein ARMOST_14413 [Armillaria ostoyae]|uniref:Uncharacterized protein n=1 Tax=Armillaria ostoyae TaxID=47428 RepID=A0A284RQI5_ARMOS|nr:uncharacterized protein ARMOST_14413 [Armillaria ostoyae]
MAPDEPWEYSRWSWSQIKGRPREFELTVDSRLLTYGLMIGVAIPSRFAKLERRSQLECTRPRRIVMIR